MAEERGQYPFAKQRVRRRGPTRGFNEQVGVRAYCLRANKTVLEEAERLCDILGVRSVGTLLNAFLAHWVVDMRQDPEVRRKLAERKLAVENEARVYGRPPAYAHIGTEEVAQAEAQWEIEEEQARQLARGRPEEGL